MVVLHIGVGLGPDQCVKTTTPQGGIYIICYLGNITVEKRYPYSGKFLQAQIFANHQQTDQEKNFDFTT